MLNLSFSPEERPDIAQLFDIRGIAHELQQLSFVL
jgi:hypothetical protein